MTARPRRIATGTIASLRERVEAEGIEIAYKALLAVCGDPKAPAQAKATAATTIFRAAGMLESFESDKDKELHEMTAAELSRFLKRTVSKIEELDAEIDELDAEKSDSQDDTNGSIFI